MRTINSPVTEMAKNRAIPFDEAPLSYPSTYTFWAQETEASCMTVGCTRLGTLVMFGQEWLKFFDLPNITSKEWFPSQLSLREERSEAQSSPSPGFEAESSGNEMLSQTDLLWRADCSLACQILFSPLCPPLLPPTSLLIPLPSRPPAPKNLPVLSSSPHSLPTSPKPTLQLFPLCK